VDPQHHDLPQERGETSQGRYDALGLLGPNGQKLRSRGQGRQLLGCLRLEVPHAVALPRQLAARQVERDREQPRLEAAALPAEEARGRPQPREGLLHQLLGHVPPPGQAENEVEGRALVPVVERTQSRRVAARHGGHQRLVRLFHPGAIIGRYWRACRKVAWLDATRGGGEAWWLDP